MNAVVSLLETSFLTRDPIQQYQIQEAGRPMPTLKMANLEIVDGNTVVHYFNAEIYKKNDWICGCTRTNSLFCFPCLLFGGDDSWSSTGYNNLVHLSSAQAMHELSLVHMKNMLSYSKYVENSKTDQKESIQLQNKRIEKNLDVLEAIIDTVKFCAFNSIKIFDHSFDDIFKLTIPSDSSVKNYLQKEPFQDLESLKADIMKAVADVIREQIIEEIRATQFVSLIVEAGDIRYPRVIILRYLKGCEIIERIWKLIYIDNINRFLDILLADLRTIVQGPTVLISQSIDQMSLKKQDDTYKLYTKVQTHFPEAQLVHFYKHDIFDVVYNVSTVQKSFQAFCGMVWGICELLTQSEQLKTTFEEIRNRFYIGSEQNMAPFDFTKHKIESVHLNYDVILETMKTVCLKSADYPDHLVCMAESFVPALEDKLHIYLLETFYKMFPYIKSTISAYENCLKPTNNLSYDDIRSILDSEVPMEQNQQFFSLEGQQQEVQVKMEKDLEIHVIDLTSVKTEIADFSRPTTSKRKWDDDFLDKKKETTVKIVYTVLSQLQELLKYRANMYASQLIDPRNFRAFSITFPDRFITTALTELHYFSAFEGMKLRAELKVLYDHQNFQTLSSACDLLREICDKKLTSTFPQTIKLLKIGLTFPSKTDDPKRCFDTKLKVQRFLKDSQRFSSIDCLVYFDCERELVDSIEDFNKKVVRKLLELPNRAEHFKVIGTKG